MINERKMITILVGTFMVSMVGLFIWTHMNKKDVSQPGKMAEDQSSVNDTGSRQESFLSALKDTEQRISKSISEAGTRKEQSTGINLEPGTFL